MTGLECAGIINSLSTFGMTVEDLICSGNLSKSSSSCGFSGVLLDDWLACKLLGLFERAVLHFFAPDENGGGGGGGGGRAVCGTISFFLSNQSIWLKISRTLANSSISSPCFS